MSTMDFEKRYRQLNTAQKQAVDHIDGPVMVIAGPGTGKTELLSVRVARILEKTDTLPENILCLTFTDSGASAMRERLTGIIGKDAYKVAIHTFHSFGTEIINQYREFFYRGALFQPADDMSRYEILRSIFDELDHVNPLTSMMNGEYSYQSDTTKVISELKRSGLTSDELRAILDADEQAIDAAERILKPLLASTVSVKVRDGLLKVMPQLQALADEAETLYEITPLSRIIASGLQHALELSESEHPTKPITAWKKKWFVKNHNNEPVFKSRASITKLRAVAHIYYEYLTRMEQAGLYDYDDMILQVVHAMEVNDELRYNLQEKYLYIMVDEFQDTNLAQMRILHNLTNNPVNESAPNLMVVGDDDQAIYSFQGADISNILRFQELYPSRELIVLLENYRSGTAIINQSREVITQGTDRLENRIEALQKNLRSQHTKATVQLFHAPTIDSERYWVVQHIAKAIKSGADPSEITVLTRRHSEIKILLPYFQAAQIDVRYERQENALDQPPIVALEQLSKVVVALAEGEHDLANSFIPELLAHPAWGIAPLELWKLSTSAYQNRQTWLEVMENLPQFIDIHKWLIELSVKSQNLPLEEILDLLMGRSDETTPSPFFDHFFSDEKLKQQPSQYLDYLTALRTIRTRLREHHTKDALTLRSFVDFIELHRRLGTSIMANRPAGEDRGAVTLMTAHKSKGLEFGTVYLMNAVDSSWGEKARTANRMINYPENLTLASAGDSSDERLRLFYVAMTRAKSQLIISYSDHNDKDSSTLIASFLAESQLAVEDIPLLDDSQTLQIAELTWYEPLTKPNDDLKQVLQPILETYKLSVTHLNAFLNITRGGPQHFLLDHLLHFPSSQSPQAAYGSAIHRTLQQVHVHLSATGEQKPIEDIMHDFETNLTAMRLSKSDHKRYFQKGVEQLQAFLGAKYDSFSSSQKAELNFAGQEVVIDEARLTGMIDVVDVDSKAKTMVVTDYKTGKPSTSWKGKDEAERIKLHNYRQQLLFYTLLIGESRDYHAYDVTSGRLEFIEPTKSGDIATINMSFDKEELDHFRQLVTSVWRRIINLDLPDVSGYDQSLKGILAFEQDLIDGNI